MSSTSNREIRWQALLHLLRQYVFGNAFEIVADLLLIAGKTKGFNKRFRQRDPRWNKKKEIRILFSNMSPTYVAILACAMLTDGATSMDELDSQHEHEFCSEICCDGSTTRKEPPYSFQTWARY